MDKIDLATLLDFINHPWFVMYNKIINDKINAYMLELREKDTKKNKLNLNRYDVIRESIIGLEEIQNEPIYALLSDTIDINEEQRGDIQKSLEDLHTKINRWKKTTKLDTIQNTAETMN